MKEVTTFFVTAFAGGLIAMIVFASITPTEVVSEATVATNGSDIKVGHADIPHELIPACGPNPDTGDWECVAVGESGGEYSAAAPLMHICDIVTNVLEVPHTFWVGSDECPPHPCHIGLAPRMIGCQAIGGSRREPGTLIRDGIGPCVHVQLMDGTPCQPKGLSGAPKGTCESGACILETALE